MNKTRLKKYAHLIASVGASVKPGQQVVINADIDQPEFVKMLVEECYKCKASKVSVEFSYQPLEKLHVRYCSEKVLGSLEDWQLAKWEHQAEVLPAKIFLVSEDPDGLKGINQKKYSRARASRAKQIKPIRSKMENKYQWCIAGVPSAGWAKKVFPDLRKNQAIEALWEAILESSRVYEDPNFEWECHNANFLEKCDKLNAMELRELNLKSSNGTDIKIGLIPEALFCGGGETTPSGVYFNPNIPTEEVFTSPMKGKAEGIVYASMPLSYGGQLIEDFWIRFKDGKAIEWDARVGAELLGEIINSDEGAAYLGEVALVPYSSPIRKSGILFYNTLYDENAACHLALGRGFSNLLRDYEKYSENEAHELGINDSITHVDFMIGTKDLSVTGIDKNGNSISIFSEGEWVI